VKKEEEGEKEKEKKLLPLPEKPLPGDCCSSECVRLWDIYEELEDYNKFKAFFFPVNYTKFVIFPMTGFGFEELDVY